MSVDVESELARLGTAWSKSVAHVDVAEVLERRMATRARPVDDMVDSTVTTRLHMRAEPRSPRLGQRWLVAAACTALVVAGVVAVAQRPASDSERVATNPAMTTSVPTDTAVPSELFPGVWVSTDTDGSSQTMEIVRSGTNEYEVVVRGDNTTGACAGAATNIIGTGRLMTEVRLVVFGPVLTCDDGSAPVVASPREAVIANFTLERNPVADELTDSAGVVWRLATDELLAPSPMTVPDLSYAKSGGMWPQSTLEEVPAAQKLADAGDPAYAWQIDSKLAGDGEPWGAKIFERFIVEGLGWEEFISGSSFSGYVTDGEGQFRGVVFVRCASGETNPLNASYSEAPPEVRGCAPTIDEFTYETVSVNVTQPARRDGTGIWVVDGWEIRESEHDPSSLGDLIHPAFDRSQVEQVAPPSDAEVTNLLEAFLRARVDGEGAEQYMLREPEESPFEDTEVPLLYATTGGASYERSEMERVKGPVWPNGWMEYRVRLFAGDETVIEQYFHVVRLDGQLGLLHGDPSNNVRSSEPGQSEAVSHSIFGTMTFTAPPLRPRGDGRIEIPLTANGGRVIIGEDPVPESNVRDDCLSVPIGTASPRASDAAALARIIEAEPDFEITETVPVSIAGIDGLQMDVTFSEQDLCYTLWSPSRRGSGTEPQQVPIGEWRMRLYLVDYPESSWPSESNWRPQVLTIAIISPATDIERALEFAAPIVASLEFRPG